MRGQQLSLFHAYIYSLANSAYPLLAPDYFGFGIVSCLLDTAASIPFTRVSIRRSFRLVEKRHYVARPVVASLTIVIAGGVIINKNFTCSKVLSQIRLTLAAIFFVAMSLALLVAGQQENYNTFFVFI